MLRRLFAGLVGLVVLGVVGLAIADDYAGKCKKIGDDKITITVKDGDKEKDVELMVSKDCKVTKGKKDGAISDVKEGSMVKASTEKKDGKEVCTKISIGKGK